MSASKTVQTSFLKSLFFSPILGILAIFSCSSGRDLPPVATFGEAAQRRISISEKDRERIGKKVWMSECAGTVEGLTSWNTGEAFPSMGIGHFIWYPSGVEVTYEESFPQLLQFLQSRDVALPDWLRGDPDCPWASRSAFLADLQGERLQGLRSLLHRTVPLQAEFLAQRLRSALPKMVQAVDSSARERVTQRFYRVAGRGHGVYALVDYVNFKGEGTNPKERYQGQGWGLLQVLEEMRDLPDAQVDFSEAAKRVLARRVDNAARDESRWLAGWHNRCAGYARSLSD